MPSLAEMTGALATWAFVPADVVSAQAATQAQLQANSDRLNSNVAQTLATAKASGILTDGQAKASLQDMNRAQFLVSDSDRALGVQVGEDIKTAAAEAPGVFADAVRGSLNGVAGTIWRAIPWWIWAIVGLYFAFQLMVFLSAMRKST